LISLNNYNVNNIKNDILSGLVVAVALVPEAIAFSFIAGVSPIIGLYTAFILGLITALIGGKAGMISGATGAVAVVLISLTMQTSTMLSSTGLSGDQLAFAILQYITLTAVLAGIIQVSAGIFKLGKFIRLVPQPALYGFVNGLAIVIASAQFKMFENEGYIMYALVLLTMAIMYILPKFTKSIPAGLVSIIAITLVVYYANLDTKVVGDLADLSEFANTLPSFSIPTTIFSLDAIYLVLPYAIIVALVGLIESLLTLSVLDEMSDTHGNGNKECIAQGSGNIICGFFGAMPGCAMIGQSIINFTSGGLGRLSGIVASIGLITLVASMSGLLNIIPVSVLVGIMFMVSIGTFEWSSFSHLKNMPRHDAFVMIVVTIITVIFDLAIAVISGVIVSSLVFAWRHAKIYSKNTIKDDTKIYELEGILFFGSTNYFCELFDIKNDPRKIIIDFKNTKVMDASGVEAINSLIKKYEEENKSLSIKHLSNDCKKLLHNSKLHCTYEQDDPTYIVAIDK
jgi:SulP family sulfate permease